MPKPKTMTTEVVAVAENDRRQSRHFGAAEKARVLVKADRCDRGQLGELLRRASIYSSYLTNWRAQLKHGGAQGLEPHKPGRKPTLDAKDRRIEQLEKELRISKALIEVQKKAHETLGMALPRVEDATEDDSSNSSDRAGRVHSRCHG